MKQYIAKNNINFYIIDATHIAKELGLGNRTNTILQAAFFALSKIIPADKAVTLMKEAATKSYGKKGEKIVAMNHAAIDRGINGFSKVTVPAAWKTATDEAVVKEAVAETPCLRNMREKFLLPSMHSAETSFPFPPLSTRPTEPFLSAAPLSKKRGIAVNVPKWVPENCIQCNFCSYVCPHAVIRPVAMTEEEAEKAPESMKMKDMTGLPGMKFAMTVSVLDCTGCGSCVQVCPGMKGNKALEMQPLDTQLSEQEGYYGQKLPKKAEVAAKFADTTVKGSQFKQPLLEFSGACAGCGETPLRQAGYPAVRRQDVHCERNGLFLYLGRFGSLNSLHRQRKGSRPRMGKLPFEDNAEYGFGMMLANKTLRERLCTSCTGYSRQFRQRRLKGRRKGLMETMDDAVKNAPAAEAFKAELAKSDCKCDAVKELKENSDYLAKKSMWIFGGDGWAYDIGFGGLDHVIAQNEDVNILVFDTEVYSNTGGQASKSTPTGAVAQFAAAGKQVKKKDLAAIAMSYGYVYVAQVAMGADYNQRL